MRSVDLYAILIGLLVIIISALIYKPWKPSFPSYSIRLSPIDKWVVDEWAGYESKRIGFYDTREQAIAAIQERKEHLLQEEQRERMTEWH